MGQSLAYLVNESTAMTPLDLIGTTLVAVRYEGRPDAYEAQRGGLVLSHGPPSERYEQGAGDDGRHRRPSATTSAGGPCL